MLKYCENGLDRRIRLEREDEARKVTEKITEQVTKQVTEQVTEDFARKLLGDEHDINYVHKMTELPISRIKELKANLFF